MRIVSGFVNSVRIRPLEIRPCAFRIIDMGFIVFDLSPGNIIGFAYRIQAFSGIQNDNFSKNLCIATELAFSNKDIALAFPATLIIIIVASSVK